MKKYSLELVEAIKTHIKDRELHMVSFDEELGAFSFNMNLPCQLSSINIIIRVGENDLTTMGICPVRPDTNDRELMARIAEFVCRANFGLKNGNFEFDFNDGELRYRCYVPCDDQIPTQEIIRRSISTPAMMLRRYSSGIIGVLCNHMDPEAMVRECEEDLAARREALLRRLDHMASAAGKPGALPSFDEFVNMNSQSHEDPGEPAAPDTPTAPNHDNSREEGSGNSDE